jgi:hypothetical protein
MLLLNLGVAAAMAMGPIAPSGDAASKADEFFAHTGTVAAQSHFVGAPVAIYTLNPDFVRSNAAPVGVLQYTANTAVAKDGKTASVWTAPSGEVVNIASGNDEARYAAAAGPGALVLNEPQINGWYAVKDSRIIPLNAEARNSVGKGMSVADYQRLVASKYGNKMPGSAYDKAGVAGGYGEESQSWLGFVALGAIVLIGLIRMPRLRRR